MRNTLVMMIGAGMILTSCSQDNKESKDKLLAEAQIEATTPEIVEEKENTIMDVTSEHIELSTLEYSLGAATLSEMLRGEEEFTVFAPTNDAFDKLPTGAVDALLEDANEETLKNIISYHIIKGKFTTTDVEKAITENNGRLVMKTIEGEDITFMKQGEHIILKDAKGNKAIVTLKDVEASNGVVHGIDTLLMPLMK